MLNSAFRHKDIFLKAASSSVMAQVFTCSITSKLCNLTIPLTLGLKTGLYWQVFGVPLTMSCSSVFAV